uniref:Chaperonin GroEL n=1 Tax=uncultured virus TaxID=340016 RepID=A0A240F788_9VIRU|nr:chaperonin GroEL [uncultured virus]
MDKKIMFSDEARQKLLNGVDKLADAVVATLGPAGRNAIIEQDMGSPVSTKDGVTVAKSIDLEDRVENIGAQLVKQASIKTADQAGDGTTTSTLLAREIYKQGLEVMTKGANAVDVKRGIDEAVKKVVDYLVDDLSKDITDEEQLKQVATISANNDIEVGELISTAMDKVGRDGVVTIEESRTGETYLETVEGMQFSRGYKSPYFVTDNNSMQAVLRDPLILITDKRLNQVKELLPILEAVSQQNKSLLIIADDIDGEALSTLVVNKMRGILHTVAVKAPDFGDRKKAILEDIAVLTGGTVVSSEKGMRLEKFDSNWFGKAKKVTVGKENTTIIDALGSEEAIEGRVNELKAQIDESNSPYEIEKLQERLAAFIGGVAIVHVGGHTEVEMKEKKDRVDDALHATKAALEEGILPGGGIALLNASKYLASFIQDVEDYDRQTGYDIIVQATEKPFYQILTNAGYSKKEIGDIEEEVLLQEGDLWAGYNPREQKIVNMFSSGIIDPTKVTRLALENAASVAGTMLITETVISNIKTKEEKGIDPNMMM